jgi:hypothetical protein
VPRTPCMYIIVTYCWTSTPLRLHCILPVMKRLHQGTRTNMHAYVRGLPDIMTLEVQLQPRLSRLRPKGLLGKPIKSSCAVLRRSLAQISVLQLRRGSNWHRGFGMAWKQSGMAWGETQHSNSKAFKEHRTRASRYTCYPNGLVRMAHAVADRPLLFLVGPSFVILFCLLASILSR